MTTEDLEASTRQFAEASLNPAKRPGKKARGTSGGKKQRQRALRYGTTRAWRGAEKSSSDDDEWWGPGGNRKKGRKGGRGRWWGSSSKSGKGSGKGGKWSSSKSGKWSDDGWGHEELFYMLPTACPNHCVSSDVDSTHEMTDVLKTCADGADSQMWRVKSDGSYVMVESYDHPGMCIAVDYEKGDDEAMLAQTCFNGELFLKECYDGSSSHDGWGKPGWGGDDDDDGWHGPGRHPTLGTEWYFTGGQLVNSMCWGAGLSSMMTIFLEDKNNVDLQECTNDLAVWGANDEAVLKADTFMFVNHLPEAPFTNVIEDVLDLLKEKLTKDSRDGMDLIRSELPDSEGDT
ncbi:hypothetical protein ACHAXT_011966 [Thalassiosira profunda]